MATSAPLGVFKRIGVRAGGAPGKIAERERDEERPLLLSPIWPSPLIHFLHLFPRVGNFPFFCFFVFRKKITKNRATHTTKTQQLKITMATLQAGRLPFRGKTVITDKNRALGVFCGRRPLGFFFLAAELPEKFPESSAAKKKNPKIPGFFFPYSRLGFFFFGHPVLMLCC